jgi:hypothetical protein
MSLFPSDMVFGSQLSRRNFWWSDGWGEEACDGAIGASKCRWLRIASRPDFQGRSCYSRPSIFSRWELVEEEALSFVKLSPHVGQLSVSATGGE